MKLKELSIDELDFNNLLPGQQKNIKEILLQCDEFKNVTEFEILQHPTVLMTDDEFEWSESAKTYKMEDEFEIYGKCYLYNIFKSPKMYDSSDLLIPVKDGISITPTIYDDSFKPRKKICIEISPEELQDITIKKQELLNKINEVLDNPDEYLIKTKEYICIRGIFEKIKINNTIHDQKIKGTLSIK